MAYAKARKLKTADAAYIAGLIDGEGTITLTREHANENRRLVVSISNTELPILHFVREVCGIGKITGKRIYSDRHMPSYVYKVTNRQALALLDQIARYLHSYKSARAKLALKEYLLHTPRNGRYTAKQSNERRHFEKKFLEIVP